VNKDVCTRSTKIMLIEGVQQRASRYDRQFYRWYAGI